ncbi:MAG: hypothetical protein Kow0010_16590 [Dehalococcoidia bacterium]
MTRVVRWTLVVPLLLILGLVACGDDDDVRPTPTADTPGPTATATLPPTETPSPAASPTATPAAETIGLKVYFLRDEKVAAVLREVPATQAVGRAAMEELLRGPTLNEVETGLSSAIPEGTRLLGLDISGGVATVDLSSEYESGGGSLSMMARLAQVVYTLTQFSTVDAVSFRLDGKPVEVFGGEGILLDGPVDRSDFEDLTPAIFVDSPPQGATVSSPVRVTGTANTFEAVFQLNIVDREGLIIAEAVAMATSGSGTRGTFDVTIPFELEQPGAGAIIVFEESARDGSQVNVVEIPVNLEQ